MLTTPSRKGSPGPPARAHRQLPRRITGCFRIDSPDCSRKSSLSAPEKSHLWSAFNAGGAQGGRQCARILRRNRRYAEVTSIRNRPPRTRQLDEIALCRRSRSERRTDPHSEAKESNDLHAELQPIRSVAAAHHRHRAFRSGCARHRRTSRHTRRRDYGCSFILNPTTPGSSVVDTSKPQDFASEIIAVFSRSASPTIQAVPRDRA